MVSANPKFVCSVLQKFFNRLQIKLAERTSELCHKHGVEEKNNATFKHILEKVANKAATKMSQTLMARASLVAGLF